MSVPNAVWLMPVRFAATSYALRATINGVTETLSFPASGSLTAGRDYWVSGDGQSGTEATGTGKADLVSLLQATLRTHSNGASATAVLSTSTFKVTVASGGVQLMRLVWSSGLSTLDPRIFGWQTGVDTSLYATITAPYAAQGMMLPGRAIAEDSLDYQPSVGGVASSISGLTRTSRMALGARHRDVLFRYLAQSAAVSATEGASQDEWTTVEHAWTYAISRGWPVRAYDQASDIASGAYRLYRTRSLEYPLGRDEANSVWWRARFQFAREVDSR